MENNYVLTHFLEEEIEIDMEFWVQIFEFVFINYSLNFCLIFLQIKRW